MSGSISDRNVTGTFARYRKQALSLRSKTGLKIPRHPFCCPFSSIQRIFKYKLERLLGTAVVAGSGWGHKAFVDFRSRIFG